MQSSLLKHAQHSAPAQTDLPMCGTCRLLGVQKGMEDELTQKRKQVLHLKQSIDKQSSTHVRCCAITFLDCMPVDNTSNVAQVCHACVTKTSNWACLHTRWQTLLYCLSGLEATSGLDGAHVQPCLPHKIAEVATCVSLKCAKLCKSCLRGHFGGHACMIVILHLLNTV